MFDAYHASIVPLLKDYANEQELMQKAGVCLLDRIGPSILITHSQGGTHGWLWADARPDLVKAIVAVEPSVRLSKVPLLKIPQSRFTASLIFH